MGQTESVSADRGLGIGSFLIVSNALPEVFEFDPAESIVISYAIDVQTSPNFKNKSLSTTAVLDAQQVLDSFVKVGAVTPRSARLYVASKNTESCTVNGMKKTFQDQACKVGPNGLFVFHFTGHGIKVSNKRWGLAPVDFDYSNDTYITAEVLSQWLNEIECKAKYILITLDCCYAGGIGKELTEHTDLDRDVNLFVISACTGYETSLVLASLGHSIFAYFLSECIVKFSEEIGVLPMSKIFSECRTCCECMSSMLVAYSKESGLQIKFMRPQVSARNIVSDSDDFSDAAMGLGRFQFIFELYNNNLPIERLCDKSIAYLESLKDGHNGPLVLLEKRGLLEGKVIETSLCSVMYSMASIELACDTNLTKVKNINLSLTAFIQVASTIDMIHPGVEFDGAIFFLSWLFYKEVMNKNNIEVCGMIDLEFKLRERFLPHAGRNQADMTDSDEVEVESSVSPSLFY